MHHFFVAKDQVNGLEVRLAPPQVHQVVRVLRLRAGDRIVVLDGLGNELEAELVHVSPTGVTARGTAWRPSPREPRVHVALALGLLKGERMEWAIQKGTEVGVSRFIPVYCARSVVRLTDPRAAEKRARWQRVALEAAEQCRRGCVPTVDLPTPFDAVLGATSAFHLTLIAVESGGTPLRAVMEAARSETRQVLLLVGPEGGFAAHETRAALDAGLRPVSLGARVLRAETAAIVGTALLLHHLDE
ncbi:MAG: 16S rRNA (uracil(1498)-N(3))-methyltransferase [Armatimonadota bacterium]|jgi:16S rRNA (uracil1498-N3)-methyltransferase|nr:16S rRNA (uracil(1498)-N(3))-methyltransferase [Armatimonadota bacterium]